MAARKTPNKQPQRASKPPEKPITKRRRIISGPIWVLLIIIITGCVYAGFLEKISNENTDNTPVSAETPPPVSKNDGEIDDTYAKVHFINVGQGDSELIINGTDAVLIDAGESDYGQTVTDYIKALGITELKYIVATHPHSDHVGGLPVVIENFTVGEIFYPVLPESMVPTTKTWENVLTAAETADVPMNEVSAGFTFSVGKAEFTVVSPQKDSQFSDLNDYSVVLKMDFGKTNWLFTGDAEAPAEKSMLASGLDISAEVLKIGHHGSANSSTAEFLEAVKPQVCVIEVGAGNSYGHPTDSALRRLSEVTGKIFRTDISGDIVLNSDGEKIYLPT
ncbi:MAG: MBL fold metallo-hydrolase [Ruminococcus sp.]|jgi:competence protein ComEC|nr:MBL fold metallo-hydrolase [Ruminococcus sp.]